MLQLVRQRREVVGVKLAGHEQGVVVVEVLAGFPAEQAGLEPGSILLQVDGKR